MMRVSQRGLSYWSVLFGITFFALSIKVIATVGPIYLDYYTLDKLIQAKFRDPLADKLEVKKFATEVAAQMERNNMRDRKMDELMLIRKEGDKTIIDLDYEERRNLISNLDVIAHFKKSYSTEKPDGYIE